MFLQIRCLTRLIVSAFFPHKQSTTRLTTQLTHHSLPNQLKMIYPQRRIDRWTSGCSTVEQLRYDHVVRQDEEHEVSTTSPPTAPSTSSPFVNAKKPVRRGSNGGFDGRQCEMQTSSSSPLLVRSQRPGASDDSLAMPRRWTENVLCNARKPVRRPSLNRSMVSQGSNETWKAQSPVRPLSASMHSRKC